MPQFADRVKVTSTTTGNGTLTLSSSGASGYQAFPSSLDGETVGYVIEAAGATDWEIGTGVYTHSGYTLTRSLRSSSTGSLLNLSSGTHSVFLAPAAQDLQIVEAFSSTSDLPSASASHGRIYHVHGEGAMYFAHAGNWIKLANYSDISGGSSLTVQDEGSALSTSATALNFVGSGVTASGTGATKTITIPGGGGGSSTSALTETTFSATANQTAFVVSSGITNAANVSVFQNGVKLEEGSSKDYTVNASTITVTLTSGATLNDVVEVLEFGQPSSSGGVTVYNNYSDLPSSGNTDGDLGWVKDVSGSGATKALYVWDGAEWDRVYSDAQEGPEFTTSPASSYDLTGGNNTDVTVAASDPDGFPIEYSVVTNPTNQAQATITQPSTGTFRFAASSSSSNAGTFTAKFVADDGVQKATASASFSLSFAVYGDRGLTGAFSVSYNDINYYDITTSGNASDFGDLLSAGHGAAACSNGSRALFGGQGATNVIQYVTTSVTGNATDFGDLTSGRQRLGACADATRGIFAGGSSSDVIDYVTIATTGDATDFGDLSATATACAACANATRGVIGGQIGSNSMEYITIATTGNSTNFGNLTVSRSQLASTADDTRGLFIGGYTDTETIDYITIASTGNATDFGNVSATLRRGSACSNGTRAVFHCAPSTNTLEYVTIQTLGNSSDFGDLTQIGSYTASTSGAAS